MSAREGGDGGAAQETPTLSRAEAQRLVAVLLIASLPAALAASTTRRVLGLLPEIDTSAAYLPLMRPLLLYVELPLVLASSVVAVMAPGLLLVAAAGRAGAVYRWIMEGFVASFGLVSVVMVIAQAVLGRPIGSPGFVLGALLPLTAAAGIWLVVRARAIELPRADVGGLRTALVCCLLVPVLFALALLPKFFWEALNGDGAHAYESARMLLHQALPFWTPEAGIIGNWPGINGLTLSYVQAWFLQIYGPTEAAVRVPVVLFLGVLLAGMMDCIVTRREAATSPLEHVLVWGSLLGYALVMSYSATYNPYSADVAMPATHDSLVMIFLFGAAAAWLREERRWMFVWVMLALMTSPAALPVLAGLIGGLFLSRWPLAWGSAFGHGLALLGCLAVLALLPELLVRLGSPVPGGEHGTALLERFELLAIADLERFWFAFLPCGIYPVVGLLAWRQADRGARVLAVASVFVFGVYYVLSKTSLHYFVPAMLLPVVVFWRTFPARHLGRTAQLGVAAGCLVAITLATPQSAGIYTAPRDLGARIDASGVRGYGQLDHASIATSELLGELFALDADVGVPDKLYGDSPLAWNYYAHVAQPRGPFDYLLVSEGVEASSEYELVHEDQRGAVYVRSRAVWERDRAMQPTTSRGRELFQIDRDELFLRGAAWSRFGLVSPKREILQLLGRDPDE